MKIISFKKVLLPFGAIPWGRVYVKFSTGLEKHFDLKTTEFIALTNLLENDEVFYNPDNKSFYTSAEMAGHTQTLEYNAE